jgi:transcription initiation factor TFIIB
VTEKAAYVYRKALGKGLVRGHSISAVMAAALYAACRDTETLRTLKDIAEASNMKKKDVARCYRLLIRELDIKIPMVDPVKCIVRVANRANLNERTKRLAMDIMKGVSKSGIPAGKNPMGLAAAVLYLACLNTGENRFPAAMAESASVTEVTSRNRRYL